MKIIQPLLISDYISFDKEYNLDKISIHKSVCNFVYDNNRLLSFVTEEIGNGPFNVLISEKDIETIKKESKIFRVAYNRGYKIYINDRVEIELNSRVWNSNIDVRFESDNYRNLLDIMDYYIHKSNSRGLSLLFKMAEEHKIIADRLDLKMAKLVQNNFTGFVSYSNIKYLANIIGIGKGLTPAGDDFVRGVFTGLYYFLKYDVKKMFGGINWSSKTNIISSNYIAVFLDGRIDEPMKNFLHSIGSNEVISNLEKIMNTGESSGIDYLAGFFMVFMYKDKLHFS